VMQLREALSQSRIGMIKAALEQGFAHESSGGHLDFGERCLMSHDFGQCIRCARCLKLIESNEWSNSICEQKDKEPVLEEWMLKIWKSKGFKQ
jgi:hypothetical protein